MRMGEVEDSAFARVDSSSAAGTGRYSSDPDDGAGERARREAAVSRVTVCSVPGSARGAGGKGEKRGLSRPLQIRFEMTCRSIAPVENPRILVAFAAATALPNGQGKR